MQCRHNSAGRGRDRMGEGGGGGRGQEVTGCERDTGRRGERGELMEICGMASKADLG